MAKRGFAQKAANKAVREARQARRVARQTAGGADDAQARRELRRARNQRQDLIEARKSGDQAAVTEARDAILEKYYAQFGWAQDTINANDELKGLFRQAVMQGWTDQEFQNKIFQSKWYDESGSDARKAFALEHGASSADWQVALTDATDAVRIAATNAGVQVDETQLDALAHEYLYGGWAKNPDRMSKALAAKFTGTDASTGEGDFTATGDPGTYVNKLKTLAQLNGVSMRDSWYQEAAQALITNPDALADYEQSIRNVAATTYGPYAEEIKSGRMTTTDLAAGYINAMRTTLELDNVDVFDNTIQKALTGVTDSNGKQSVMNMYDFKRMLRQDPRWKQTDNAYETYSRVSSGLARAFGVSI